MIDLSVFTALIATLPTEQPDEADKLWWNGRVLCKSLSTTPRDFTDDFDSDFK